MNVTVWRCDLDSEIASLDTLDENERARAAAFVFERHRRRYIAAHAFLRAVLAAAVGSSPTAIRFAVAEHGKPFLSGHQSVAFNMSHADQIAYVAVASGGEIGVDVELHHAIDDLLNVARMVFSPVEVEEVGDVPGDEQTARFLRGWTRKEAYVKALGVGLGAALTRITVQTGCTDVAIPPLDGISRSTFYIRSLDSLPSEYAAVATSDRLSSPVRLIEFDRRASRCEWNVGPRDLESATFKADCGRRGN